MKTKYVVGVPKGMCCELHTAVVFNELLQHKDVAEGCFIPGSVISAGFCQLGSGGEVYVYGESTTLDLRPRHGHDEKLIKQTLNY